MNYKILFRPICWVQTFLYNWDNINWYANIAMVSGHSFVEQKDGSLKCEICGKISSNQI
jgi:hypothetical protein